MRKKATVFLIAVITASFVIFFCSYPDKPSDRKIYKEIQDISSDYVRPTLSASQLKHLLFDIELNQQENLVQYGYDTPAHSLVYSIAIAYWDWGQPEQTWMLLQDYVPPQNGMTNVSTADLLLYVGLFNHMDPRTISEALRKWNDSDFPPLLSQASTDALFDQHFSPALEELDRMFGQLFTPFLIEPSTHLNFQQIQWTKNLMFLLRNCEKSKSLIPADIDLISKLAQRVYDLFSKYPYDDYYAWITIHDDLMYSMVWISHSAAALDCPPLGKDNRSIWKTRYEKIKGSLPPNAPVLKILNQRGR